MPVCVYIWAERVSRLFCNLICGPLLLSNIHVILCTLSTYVLRYLRNHKLCTQCRAVVHDALADLIRCAVPGRAKTHFSGSGSGSDGEGHDAPHDPDDYEDGGASATAQARTGLPPLQLPRHVPMLALQNRLA